MSFLCLRGFFLEWGRFPWVWLFFLGCFCLFFCFFALFFFCWFFFGFGILEGRLYLATYFELFGPRCVAILQTGRLCDAMCLAYA